MVDIRPRPRYDDAEHPEDMAMRIQVYESVESKLAWITDTRCTQHRALKVFATVGEALDWVEAATPEDIEAILLPLPVHARKGPKRDYLHPTYDIHFGVSVPVSERRAHRRAVSDAVADLAAMWNTHHHCFAGAVEIGMRQSVRGAVGVFIPSRDVIAYPRRSHGSIAHESCHRLEWFHGVSGAVRRHRWLREGSVARRARRIDAYYGSPSEVLARCFEAWTHRMLDETGIENVYLVDLPERGGITQKKLLENWPFPDGEDEWAEARMAIEDIFGV